MMKNAQSEEEIEEIYFVRDSYIQGRDKNNNSVKLRKQVRRKFNCQSIITRY